jgi:hypothetical protein
MIRTAGWAVTIWKRQADGGWRIKSDSRAAPKGRAAAVSRAAATSATASAISPCSVTEHPAQGPAGCDGGRRERRPVGSVRARSRAAPCHPAGSAD